jgi:DNA-directed RNA polymerase specialized sigma24 family protein
VTHAPETSWTLLEGVLRGEQTAHARFVRFYFPVVLAYLQSRWRGRVLVQDAEDATHEVLVEFLRENGALTRCDVASPLRFRRFLLGVARNVALRWEDRSSAQRQREVALPSPDLEPEADDADPAAHFDRRWAHGILASALDDMRLRAESGDARTMRHLSLLNERFFEGRTIAMIAGARGEDPAHLHHEYARARNEFEAALTTTLREHTSGGHAVTRDDLADMLGLIE